MAISAMPAFALSHSAFAQSASQATGAASGSQSGSPSSAQSGGAVNGSPDLSKSMEAKVEQHIKDLHAQLQITSAEEPAWNQFAAVMRNNAEQMEQAFSNRSSHLESMTADQNMQSYAHLSQLHATNMQKLASTFQALYSSFPQSQKQVADEVFRNRHRKTTATQ